MYLTSLITRNIFSVEFDKSDICESNIDVNAECFKKKK